MHTTTRRGLARRHLTAAIEAGRDLAYTAIVTADTILVRAYLVSRGMTAEFADRYGSAFGRVAARIFREQYSADPGRSWSQVNGRWRRVFGYRPHQEHVLDAAFTTYPRTAGA